MKKAVALFLILVMTVCLLVGCKKQSNHSDGDGNNSTNGNATPSDNKNLGDAEDSFGAALDDIGIYDGYFEGESTDINIERVSGTGNAYTLNGTTLTFSGIAEDTVYSISGKLGGNIVIDVSDSYKLELQFTGFSLVSTEVNPIQVKNGDKITITAKKDTKNYIYDMRETVDEADTTLTKGAIHSDVDLQIGGKGCMYILSENNNGIHTKDDLEVKNLTLTVACNDNALKGNDGVEITSGAITLISKGGDGIKTENSDISSKGNQKGSITVSGGTLTVYAACDGIDASYNAVINGESTVVNIYTDKYSNYSEDVTASSEQNYYIRCSSNSYTYSVKYYNSENDYKWVNATYSEKKGNYYYYTFSKLSEYSKLQVFVYSSGTEQGQDDKYAYMSNYLSQNSSYDTISFSKNNGKFSWTNYTVSSSQNGMGWGGGGPGGMGGMNDGNSDKGDHSTKGIKAANEIMINNGSVTIKSYDDALHADNSATLENGAAALGNITVNSGSISLYSNDDGIHAENIVYIKGGNIDIENSYEGVEGLQIFISGGNVSVYAKDDGMNSTATTGTGVTLSGGYIYIYCTGDGIDSNSRTSYSGICFEGGDAVIISNSGMNSAIDTEQGYQYTSGSVVAMMPSGGMSSEAKHCENFSSVGTTKNMNLSSGSTLTISGDMNQTITMPCSINGLVIILNKNVSVSN